MSHLSERHGSESRGPSETYKPACPATREFSFNEIGSDQFQGPEVAGERSVRFRGLARGKRTLPYRPLSTQVGNFEGPLAGNMIETLTDPDRRGMVW